MLSKGSVDAAHHAVRLFNTFPKQFYISWKMHQAFITVGICIDCLKILYVWVPAISGGGNLAASKIRNLECPSYGLKDYGCGKFIRKYIFLDLRSWEINIARTARRLGVSRNTVRHLQSLSSEEVLQQKNGITSSMPTSRPSHPFLSVSPPFPAVVLATTCGNIIQTFRTSARRPSTIMSSSSGRSTTFLRPDNYRHHSPKEWEPSPSYT